ncbi:MAG TPA: hypothetical protein DG048_14660 [Pseudoalteromonas sp.]|jgi:hypothetical protein|nr:hypothetical protein [Pseudoalteromonas sp.]|tara:strand:- start:3590 stop:4018 length:429 start_codon:yes stop_codon:yes gene_type:complete
MLLRYLFLFLLYSCSKNALGEDNYALYTIGDYIDVYDKYVIYSTMVKEQGVDLSNGLFEYQQIIDAGIARRLPSTHRILMKTDGEGELSQYIIYLSMMADTPHFNCKKIHNVFEEYFLPRKPPFYINNCDVASISFYRSYVY